MDAMNDDLDTFASMEAVNAQTSVRSATRSPLPLIEECACTSHMLHPMQTTEVHLAVVRSR